MSWPLHAYPRVSGGPVALGEGCGYNTHALQYTDMYLCVCVCACVRAVCNCVVILCHVPVCVCMCVCVYVCV